jgi:hypothetical protein
MISISEYPSQRAAFDSLNTHLDPGLCEHEIFGALPLEEFLRIWKS